MWTKRVCEIFSNKRNDDYQITDLLQFSRKERESRIHCLNIMRRRHAWKMTRGRRGSFKTVIYAKIEGLLLKRQVQDAILFYRLVKRNRIHAFKSYFDRLPPRGYEYGAAR